MSDNTPRYQHEPARQATHILGLKKYLNEEPAEPNKAGIVIYGALKRGPNAGRRAFVAPYTEGRFGAGDKYYVLPKGAIDEKKEKGKVVGRETPWEAAVRETFEETGVDVHKLIGDKGMEEFRRYGELKDFRNPETGIFIRHASLQPWHFRCFSRGGKREHIALFHIELDDIEVLKSQLKNPNNRNEGEEIEGAAHRTETIIASARHYPSFEDLMEWLSTMRMPDKAWSHPVDDKGKKLNLERDLRKAARIDVPDGWFQSLVDAWRAKENSGQPTCVGKPIESEKAWLRFCHDVDGAEYKKLERCFEVIKHKMGKLGITRGDAGLLKLDAKDKPLHFYQEGADIVLVSKCLKHTLDLCRDNEGYRRAMTGGDTKRLKGHTRETMLALAQISGMGLFAEPRDIEEAVRAHEDNLFQESPHAPRSIDFRRALNRTCTQGELPGTEKPEPMTYHLPIKKVRAVTTRAARVQAAREEGAGQSVAR